MLTAKNQNFRPNPGWLALLVSVLAVALCITAQAGIRGPGKYCGVVIFDRWGTCFLLSGHFVMYVSEGVKNKLRPYAGQAVQIDASEVSQPINPGDALIKKFQITGRAPDSREFVLPTGLALKVNDDFGPNHRPTFELRITNRASEMAQISSLDLGPTLIGVNRGGPFSPSDGLSEAWITRQGLMDRPSVSRP